MRSFLHTCATPTGVPHGWVGLDWGNPTGQQGSPAVTLSHRRDGLRVLLMAVLWPFRRSSMCRPVYREFMRSAVLDVTTIVPATHCHQRHDVEPYGRFRSNS